MRDPVRPTRSIPQAVKPGAIVLCGGRSRRMGRSKAWLPFGPERLLPRVVRLVGEAVGPLVVVAGPKEELPELPAGTLLVRDQREGIGPLAGLDAGLDAIDTAATLVYVTATDAPFLAPGWIAGLAALIGDADLVIPSIQGQLYPLAALYRRETIGPVVRSLRDRGRSRLLDLAEAVRARGRGRRASRRRPRPGDLEQRQYARGVSRCAAAGWLFRLTSPSPVPGPPARQACGDASPFAPPWRRPGRRRRGRWA